MPKYLTRSVWILSLVSMFTDISSEMLYPVMPLYLKQIGFSVVLIGVLEGVAEAVAGLSKGYFGKLSDNFGKRLPFVQLGYFLSALSKPMMAIFTYPWWIFGARTADRLGKGLRTGARDALLSEQTTPENKAKVFGFHRGLDTLGAVIGPLLALVYLQFYPQNYQVLFLLAFIPGLIGIGFTFLLKEPYRKPAKKNTSLWASFSYWQEASVDYKKLVLGLLAFALFNSSDIFLLLIIKQKGFSDIAVITVYIFYNLIYALVAFPVGILADKLGLKKALVFGLVIFAVVYAGMGFTENLVIIYILFFLYGVYAACTEGIAKAWISNICKDKHTASAIGTYAGLNSLAVLLASSIAGVVWQTGGPRTLFLVSAAAALVCAAYFGFVQIKPKLPGKSFS